MTPQIPSPAVGKTTIFGVFLTIVPLIGALVAAIEGNDVATISAAAVGILAALGTLGGRFRQAVELIRQSGPILVTAGDALAEIPGEFDATDEEPVAPPGLFPAA